ncbi:MAG: DNRLRE domain-containing protein, partial [Paenibacillaceae bacterium]|nr:DNRLRE domain-containing protein [Paenibacillaceae bacterium]
MKAQAIFRLLSRIRLHLLLAVVLAVPPFAPAGMASAEPNAPDTYASPLLASCEYKEAMVVPSTTVSCPDTISIGSRAGNSYSGVLKFDLNGLSGTVLQANLELYVTDRHANDDGSPELTIHQINGNWTQPPSPLEAAADLPIPGQLHTGNYAVTDDGGTWATFNIAPLVRDKIAKGEDELVLVLSGSWAEDPGERFFQFASSGATVPKLNIVNTTAPVQLPIPHTRIAAGDGFTLLLQNDGTVKAYGRINDHKIEVPDSLTGVQAVYASNDCGYAIREGGFVAALGDGCAVPAEVPDGNVVGLVLGGGTSAVLKNDGTIINWGREIPAEWKTIYAPFKSISGGDDHVAALTWDNAVVS